MIISDLSIKRPVLATVINLLIIIIGVAALSKLAVREYPDIETPVVSITTTYLGASPETIENTITEPLEQALNGIRDIRSIRSISSNGVSSINVEFQTSRAIDDAANDVNNVIQSALGKIPQSADKPIIAKSTANSQALMWIVLVDKKKKYTPELLSDIADRQVKTPLQILPGVGSILIGGQRKYAMRIWLDPKKMSAKNVSPDEIRKTILDNNLQLPAGQIKGQTRQFNVLADGQISNPKIFESLIIKEENGNIVRIKDIGSVELGSTNYDTIIRFNGESVVAVGVIKQSKANELKVAEEVKKSLPSIRNSIPKDIDLVIAVDNSRFVKASLREVTNSLAFAFMLVILVTLIFLKSKTATLIASLSIPVSIIGTFAAMYALDFSANVLTLLGLVLAIGLVVDDAIVVLENIFRRQEMGEDKLKAAFNGSKEIAFPVIATTVSLVAVFIPLSTLTGAVGRQFKEFALTVAASVAISGIVALTLIPALCSKFLQFKKEKNHKVNITDKAINWLNIGYQKNLRWAIKNKTVISIFLIINIIASGVLVYTFPKTSTPIEDRGLIVTIVKAPQGSTNAYTNRTQIEVEKEITMIKEVEVYFSAIGLAAGGPANPSNGLVFSRLIDWDKRKVKQQDLVNQLFPKFMRLPGAFVFPINPPSLGGSALTKDIEVVIKSSADIEEVEQITNSVISKIKQLPGLINVDSDLLISNPQLNIVFNREKASDLGISVADISMSLQVLLSEGKTNDFILRSKQYDVITGLYPKYKSIPDNIKEIYLRSKNGALVSLDSLIDIKPVVAPSQINHYDLQRSVTITASLLPGFTLGPALEKVTKIVKDELKEGFSYTYSGVSREFTETSASLLLTFILSIIFIYLVLAGLFESFIHPLTILLSVPLALLGALLTLLACNQTLNLYSAIGIILLVGLVTKNAILIVEMANQSRANGDELTNAVLHASEVRFRPIIMTSLAMILGSLPLALAHGAGAESRIAMGTAIVGGLAFSTIFTLFVIPVVYIFIVKSAEKLGHPQK
jgi:multidrug efflux pump